jgi:hypothetical protein
MSLCKFFWFLLVWSGFPLHFASWRLIGLCTGPPSALLLRPITQKDGLITMLELMEHVACQESVWIDLAKAKRRLEEKKAATFEKRCNDIDDTGGLLNGLKDQDIKCFSNKHPTGGSH